MCGRSSCGPEADAGSGTGAETGEVHRGLPKQAPNPGLTDRPEGRQSLFTTRTRLYMMTGRMLPHEKRRLNEQT